MVHLLEPALGRVSGGLRFNHAVAAAAGSAITRHRVPGRWPDPTPFEVSALTELAQGLPGTIVVDGLIGCSLPSPLEVGVPVAQLVHAPLAVADPSAQEREGRCLEAAAAVFTTSRFAASEIDQLYGLPAAILAPGASPRPQAVGGTGGNLICVGSVEENKNQIFLAQVLTMLARTGTTGWHCTFAGPVTQEAYAKRLRAALAELPTGSVDLPGQLDGSALDALYHGADLLLLPSRRETFGMVVTEAAAAGVPAFVTADTGAEEALVAGRALRLDVVEWADALTRWLTDADDRPRMREHARSVRGDLRTWTDTATALFAVLSGLG